MVDFLIEHPFTYNLTVLLSVVLLKIILSIFVIKEPLHLFKLFCTLLAKKVNNPNNSISQQKIAGLIGIITTVVPIVIILWLFEDFIEVTWLWQCFLLYLALGSFGITRLSMKIAKALIANQSYEAKQLISPLVLRETDKLSTLGLSKATIELQLLQSIQQCFVVSFYFLIAGPLGALTFRLLLEIHYSWNIKQLHFKAFGKHIDWIIKLLQWLPTRLFVFGLMLGTLGKNFILFWQLIKKHFFKLSNSIALYGLALAINKKLGGVVIYDNNKLRRLSFNDQAREPEPYDIINAVKRVNQVLYFYLSSLILGNFIFILVTIKI
jgi:adenosylcobinamide-phosphate synthase